MSANEIEKFVFDSGKDGKTLAVFGAVHGNEKCGTIAIRRAINDGLKPVTGKIIYVPICNPRAYAENIRFIQRNLNRHLYVKQTQIAYEDTLDATICGILDEADILLDLHSYESKGDAFIFLGESKAENDFALSLGVNDFVYGWAEAFSNSSETGTQESIGTTEYIRKKGGIGITLECGHHSNQNAPEVGYQGIVNAINYLNNQPSATNNQQRRVVKMQQVFYKNTEGKTEKAWKHYDQVKTGDVLATYDDGSLIEAQKDGYIILPKANPKLGGEWFYFGVAKDFPT